MTDNEKIANLTGDAIRMSSEAVVKEITDAAQMAERVAGDLRIEADQLAADIRRATDDLVGRINDFVIHCQDTSSKIREVRKDRAEALISQLEKVNAEVGIPKAEFTTEQT